MHSIAFTMVIVLHSVLPPQEAMVVERARVGPISIGATAHSVYDKFGDRTRLVDLKLEGMLSPALEVKLFGSQLVASIIAEIGPANNQLVVTRIHVVDPSLRTKEGVGVGSTYEELRSRYSVDWVGSGEGRFFARVEALGISFQLERRSLGSPMRNLDEPDSVAVAALVEQLRHLRGPVIKSFREEEWSSLRAALMNEGRQRDAELFGRPLPPGAA